jgi:hypothetical protein
MRPVVRFRVGADRAGRWHAAGRRTRPSYCGMTAASSSGEPTSPSSAPLRPPGATATSTGTKLPHSSGKDAACDSMPHMDATDDTPQATPAPARIDPWQIGHLLPPNLDRGFFDRFMEHGEPQLAWGELAAIARTIVAGEAFWRAMAAWARAMRMRREAHEAERWAERGGLPKPKRGPEVTEGLLASCFLPRDSRWRSRDPWGERLLVVTGKTFRAAELFEMRRRHLDAWERPLDALRHAPGLLACRVRLSGTIECEGYPRYYITHGGGEVTTHHGHRRWIRPTYEGVGWVGRLYASEYAALWTVDATLLVHRFACDLAEQALESERSAGREPDARAWAMVTARRAWLTGNLDDEGLRRAWEAFWAAVREHHERTPTWVTHHRALWVVRNATEPVSLAEGRSVQNAKNAAFTVWAGLPSLEGETQEERITRLAAREEATNAELERLLIDAFGPDPK